MELTLNPKEQEALNLLLAIPPDLARTRKMLSNLPAEGITKVAISYAEQCYLEVKNAAEPMEEDAALSERVLPGLHSTYILEVMEQLLQAGADPNAVFDTEYSRYNLMDSLVHIDNGFLAADALALVMEHGGDPNLVVDEVPLFEMVDYDVWFGAAEQYDRWRYAAWVHEWMVLLAYGGSLHGAAPAIRTFREFASAERFDLKKLKDHRRFYIALSVEDKERTLHIYDRSSLWEVANAKSAWN